jgi:hypothetical protein
MFEEGDIAPVFSNAPNDHKRNKGSIEQHRGYSFYAGHYGYDVFDRFNDGHLLVTNFRDPVERILSLYRFWRNNISTSDIAHLDPRDAAVVLLSHELDFSKFIRSSNPDLRLYINNFHFRQLLGSPWETWPVRAWHMFQVKRRISKLHWFYVAETPNVSAALLRKAFPELPSIELRKDNMSVGEPVELLSADAEHLIHLNRLDYAIYYYALREQMARLA